MLPEPRQRLPRFDVPAEYADAPAYLRQLVADGAARRYGMPLPAAVRDRLNTEFRTIRQLAFADYFLIVHDVVTAAREHGILVGPGRGSAAGSLVLFCLGVVAVDPLANGLLFERFLDPDRADMPDVDLDFDSDGQAWVFSYLTRRWGADRVARLGTFGYARGRQAVKDAARVLLAAGAPRSRSATHSPPGCRPRTPRLHCGAAPGQPRRRRAARQGRRKPRPRTGTRRRPADRRQGPLRRGARLRGGDRHRTTGRGGAAAPGPPGRPGGHLGHPVGRRRHHRRGDAQTGRAGDQEPGHGEASGADHRRPHRRTGRPGEPAHRPRRPAGESHLGADRQRAHRRAVPAGLPRDDRTRPADRAGEPERPVGAGRAVPAGPAGREDARTVRPAQGGPGTGRLRHLHRRPRRATGPRRRARRDLGFDRLPGTDDAAGHRDGRVHPRPVQPAPQGRIEEEPGRDGGGWRVVRRRLRRRDPRRERRGHLTRCSRRPPRPGCGTR